MSRVRRAASVDVPAPDAGLPEAPPSVREDGAPSDGASELSRWREQNKALLVAELGRVRLLLERRLDGATSVDVAAQERRIDDLRRSLIAPSALDVMRRAFALDDFEVDVLLLCAGFDLEESIRAVVLRAAGDVKQARPTFSLALSALSGGALSALLPASSLRRWELVQLVDEQDLFGSALRIDEPILHFLVGLGVDPGGRRVVPSPPPFAAPVPSHARLVSKLASSWGRLAEAARTALEMPLVELSGPDLDSRRAVAAHLAAGLGFRLSRISSADLPPPGPELDLFVARWNRTAALADGALLVEVERPTPGEPLRQENVRRLASQLLKPLLFSTRDPMDLDGFRVVRGDVRRPEAAEQRDLWAGALARVWPDAEIDDEDLDGLAGQFDLNEEEIHAAVLKAQADHGSPFEPLWPGEVRRPLTSLREVCRERARGVLDGLAQRVPASARREDLVLPAAQREILDAIAEQVRHRFHVYARWGFASRSERGLGISALFHGESGTGKTTAAEVLARELELDLYRVDLASVVSKYIGETEKNLRQIFDAAEGAGAILLFDEADALFGRRSEVKDSHDRYANLEVSYLLQRMEAYGGLCVLTTNLKDALDDAFTRRIRFVVEFPFPGREERRAIWSRIFPAGTPTKGLDYDKLSHLNVSGGHIKNIAVAAAFLAAAEASAISMSHLLLAARRELAKANRTASASEIGDWA